MNKILFETSAKDFNTRDLLKFLQINIYIQCARYMYKCIYKPFTQIYMSYIHYVRFYMYIFTPPKA